MTHRLRAGLVLIVAAVAAGSLTGSRAGTRTFYDDDPLTREPETQDASQVHEWDIDLAADLLINSFSRPGDPRENVPAGNVNTVDEVPDSNWFTNRVYARPVTIEELRRGPNTTDGPAPGRLTVIRPKTAGVAPGFTVRDSRGETWFITFDARSAPRAATGAIAVAVRLFWALGYYQIESYLTTVRPQDIDIAETALTPERYGKRRRLTMRDIEDVFKQSAVNPDGSYRAMAGRAVSGRPLGGFRFHGTRPDDPNDVVPHEHRRELRALKVFGAWANLVDMKAGNTLDSVIEQDGRHVVRHYLQDVGSTFGTGAQGPREWDEGHEYLFESDPMLKRLVTFGFYLQPWQTVPYEKSEEIGRFEGDEFEPERWRSRVPVASVLRARDDDTFWAALRVGAFTDDMIREAVRAGQYADSDSGRLLADVLIKRRDKIVRAYLPKITPLVRFTLDDQGLAFENAAVAAGAAGAPRGGYRALWYSFDNNLGTATPIGESAGPAGRLSPPARLTTRDGDFVRIDIAAVDPPHSSWTRPVRVHFRRQANRWTLVGVERVPAAAAKVGADVARETATR